MSLHGPEQVLHHRGVTRHAAAGGSRATPGRATVRPWGQDSRHTKPVVLAGIAGLAVLVVGIVCALCCCQSRTRSITTQLVGSLLAFLGLLTAYLLPAIAATPYVEQGWGFFLRLGWQATARDGPRGQAGGTFRLSRRCHEVTATVAPPRTRVAGPDRPHSRAHDSVGGETQRSSGTSADSRPP